MWFICIQFYVVANSDSNNNVYNNGCVVVVFSLFTPFTNKFSSSINHSRWLLISFFVILVSSSFLIHSIYYCWLCLWRLVVVCSLSRSFYSTTSSRYYYFFILLRVLFIFYYWYIYNIVMLVIIYHCWWLLLVVTSPPFIFVYGRIIILSKNEPQGRGGWCKLLLCLPRCLM